MRTTALALLFLTSSVTLHRIPRMPTQPRQLAELINTKERDDVQT